MKVPDPDEERPVAWQAILADTPVFSSDGHEVGVIYEVLGAEDIFHGIVVRAGVRGHDVMVPADGVRQITNRRIDLGLSDEAIRDLQPYVEEESYALGIVGLIRKRLGWVEDDGQTR